MKLIMDIVFILLSLCAGVFLYSVLFWLLTNKEIPYGKALRLSCMALVLNKFFFTGFGYAAISGILKRDNFPLHKSLSAFMLSEIIMIVPWVISGVCFGANLALNVPLFFLIVLALGVTGTVLKRKKALAFFRQASSYARQTSVHLKIAVPLAILNVFFGVVYYYFLFDSYAVAMTLREVFKIVSVSFTVGYVSPLPSGLAFREGSIIYFLMLQGQTFAKSLAIALTDRICISVFYGAVGLFCGPRTILESLRGLRKG